MGDQRDDLGGRVAVEGLAVDPQGDVDGDQGGDPALPVFGQPDPDVAEGRALATPGVAQDDDRVLRRFQEADDVSHQAGGPATRGEPCRRLVTPLRDPFDFPEQSPDVTDETLRVERLRRGIVARLWRAGGLRRIQRDLHDLTEIAPGQLRDEPLQVRPLGLEQGRAWQDVVPHQPRTAPRRTGGEKPRPHRPPLCGGGGPELGRGRRGPHTVLEPAVGVPGPALKIDRRLRGPPPLRSSSNRSCNRLASSSMLAGAKFSGPLSRAKRCSENRPISTSGFGRANWPARAATSVNWLAPNRSSPSWERPLRPAGPQRDRGRTRVDEQDDRVEAGAVAGAQVPAQRLQVQVLQVPRPGVGTEQPPHAVGGPHAMPRPVNH